MRSLRLLFILACMPFLGCDYTERERANDELAEARTRWRATGVVSYRYDIVVNCFCPPPRTVSITVVDGIATTVVYADSGTAVPSGVMQGLRTVEQLFERIGTILAQRPASVLVSYDSILGYPTQVTVDEVRGIADDEYAILVTTLQTAP